MNKIYWIEIKRLVRSGKWQWYWQIKCRNGRVKCESVSIYTKKCLCLNDANAIAESLGMGVRT